MSCSTYSLKGIARGCRDSIGGIKKVWLASDYDKVIAGVRVDETNTLSFETALAAEFKVFNFFKNTGSMTSTLNTSENAGNSWTTEVALQFMKMETSKRLEVEAMVMGECAAVVLDVNGKYWFLGKDNPITGSAATATTGTANTDLNGYNVTLTDNSLNLPYEITNAEAIGALEAIKIV